MIGLFILEKIKPSLIQWFFVVKSTFLKEKVVNIMVASGGMDLYDDL
jgi:hypothetical protein